jgi:hypothetical protein
MNVAELAKKRAKSDYWLEVELIEFGADVLAAALKEVAAEKLATESAMRPWSQELIEGVRTCERIAARLTALGGASLALKP